MHMQPKCSPTVKQYLFPYLFLVSGCQSSQISVVDILAVSWFKLVYVVHVHV